MFLGNPSLPVNMPVNEALEETQKILKEKNWLNFELGSLKLVLMPFFYFNYHYYREKENNGEKVIESSVDGFLALNGSELRINEDITDLIKNNLKTITNTAPEIEFEEKETSVEKREQDEVLKFKTAEFFQIPKDNVVISSARKLFVPFYETFITIEKNTFEIKINAVTKEIIGIEEVPEREKGFLEITKETIEDLSRPEGWIRYSKELLVGGSKKIPKVVSSKSSQEKKKSFSMDLSFFSTKWFLAIIIILALFLIFLALFY